MRQAQETMTRSGVVSSLQSVLLTSQVFTSGNVNTGTILHFFFKITNERGTKTVFTCTHVKWFYSQSERAYYLNNFIENFVKLVAPKGAVCLLWKLLVSRRSSFTLDYGRNNFPEVANIYLHDLHHERCEMKLSTFRCVNTEAGAYCNE